MAARSSGAKRGFERCCLSTSPKQPKASFGRLTRPASRCTSMALEHDKVHALVDVKGRPVKLLLSAGNRNDIIGTSTSRLPTAHGSIKSNASSASLPTNRYAGPPSTASNRSEKLSKHLSINYNEQPKPFKWTKDRDAGSFGFLNGSDTSPTTLTSLNATFNDNGSPVPAATKSVG